MMSKNYWFDGCPVRTHFCDAMSVLFPPWELAFAKIVAAYKEDIHDPALLSRMDEFIAQETAHGKAHHSHNARVGITDLEDKEFEKIKLVLRRPKMRIWLASMVSIEHIASGLSRHLLSVYGDHTGREFAMYRWHAVEELQHKSLALDLWDALGYTRKDLKRLARGNLLYVLRFLIAYTTDKLRQDRIFPTPRVLGGVMWCLWRSCRAVGLSRLLANPKFHPDNIDDSALIARFI